MSDLVVVSLESWDGVWRRNQHLVSRLLADDPDLRVLFVEPPADPVHDARRRAPIRRGRGLRPGDLPGASGRLWLFQPTKWLPRRVDPRANSGLTSSVVTAARNVGMSSPALWLNDPLAWRLLQQTGWPAVYDITDDWLLAPRSDREIARLHEAEGYLLVHCRHVVVCSPRLLETKAAERVTLIPNAVDLESFQAELSRPADLPAGRVVLYVGTLHRDRLDVDLCVAVARALRGTATFVLVGPVALDADDEALLRSAGAVLLGSREHATIPAYLNNADVLVVPHVVTAFTDSLDPIKVYEYLAAGRPVVSTPVAGFRELDETGVRVVADGAFVGAVTHALEDAGRLSPPSGIASWSERARDMQRVLDGLRD